LGEKYAENNRDMVYRIFDDSYNNQMPFAQFAKFIKFSWTFIAYETYNTGFINDKVIFEKKKSYSSPIPYYREEVL
jgi:hypothetical protein